MKKLHILIDDIRDLEMDIICRNARVGFRTVVYFTGDIECLYMDHDLGPASKTGYDVLKELLLDGYCPNKVQLVTSNPVGRLNMAELLIGYGYIPEINGINFKKE